MGSGQRRLFAVYDPPASSPGEGRAVVLCAPWGQEYLTSHRSFRRLALDLSGIGCDVLRFDWYGCGDSAGDTQDGEMSGWLEDLGTAIEELKAMSGAATVRLVGLRLGAALGWQAAATRSDVSQLVLWDPVVCGRDYVLELEAMERAAAAVAWMRNARKASPNLEVLGFPMTAELRQQLEAVDLRSASGVPSRRVVLLCSEDRACYDDLRQRLVELGVDYDFEVVPSPLAWVEQPQMAAGVVPGSLLDRITRWIGETR